jgi:ATP-dependent helicase/nuclease subunit A
MTVHGAKGLEAPIVILPETEDKKPSERNDIQKLENNFPVWRASASESPAPLLAAKALKDQRSTEENLRLLYVAMTRAKNWLIVAAAGECKTPNSWYRLIEGGMTSAGAVAQADQTLRYSNGVWPDGALGVTQNVTRSICVLDGWANTYLGTVPRPPQPLSPSNLGGAKVLGGQTSDEETLQAKRRGTAIHALLETLPEYPPMQWPAISARLVPADLDFDDIYQEATQLLRDPNLAHVFVKNALVEVTVNCTVFGRPMIGTIDRLVVDKDRVLAIDFKSNAVVPTTAAQVPEGLLRQMGAYQEALTQIYPGLRIDVAILWSKTGDLMLLDNDMVRNAFARAAISGMSALDEPYADT